MTRDAPKARRQKRRESRRERGSFEEVRRAELHYAAQLRKVARQVGHLADLVDESPGALKRIEDILRRYAEDIRPWATAVAAGMLADVNQRDQKAWLRIANVMGEELEREIREAPTGIKMRELLAEQVALITSIPRDAAERVHKFALQGVSTGERAAEIRKALVSTHHVSIGRANLIARTEVGRASGALTQARAEYVESPGYIWRSLGDTDVRPLHRRLNGKFFKWSEPPVSGSSGERAHAGMIYNCRCYPEPVIP